jgi:ATP synthase I chain
MKETKISDIERINIIVLVIGSILAMVIMREFKYVFSFAVASAIMTLNFRFLKKIIEGGLLEAENKKIELAIKLPLKFLILVAFIAVVVIYGDIDLVFFLVGLSTVFISVVINQFSGLWNPAAKRRQKNGA